MTPVASFLVLVRPLRPRGRPRARAGVAVPRSSASSGRTSHRRRLVPRRHRRQPACRSSCSDRSSPSSRSPPVADSTGAPTGVQPGCSSRSWCSTSSRSPCTSASIAPTCSGRSTRSTTRASQLDGLATTRTHMFENLLRYVPAQAALFVLGMPASTVATALLISPPSPCHGHSNLRIGVRWIELVFVTPRLHRLHHLPRPPRTTSAPSSRSGTASLGRLVTRDASPTSAPASPARSTTTRSASSAAFRQPVREAQARLSMPAAPKTTNEVAPAPDRTVQ